MASPTPPPVEGRDGAVVRYEERLRSPWWLWAAALFITGSLGIAYGFVLGRPAGVITFVLATAAAVYGLLRSAPVVRVDDLVVRAGRARLPLAHVGGAEALGPEEMAALRGPRADARAYLCQRPHLPGGVRIDVDDDRDPHPYWLVSSRDPQRLAAAVRDAAGAPGRAG